MNFNWQGQACGRRPGSTCTESIYDEFVAAVAAAMAELKIGDPRDEATDVGAIVSRSQFESIRGYIERGSRIPARDWSPGGMPEGGDSGGGFDPPTLFAIEDESRFPLAAEEIFGPVLVAMPFDDVGRRSASERASARADGERLDVRT